MRRELLIVGLGLIGGAIGIALRRRGWRVRYLDPFVSLDEAQRAEAADERATAIDGDFVLLATPVDVAIAMLSGGQAILPVPPAPAGQAGLPVLHTSVCSVMQPLRAAAKVHFVAGHPMAGWHESRLENAAKVVFDGKPWFLDADDDRVEQLVRDCGAEPVRVDAEEHDRGVALTSHLPQILSTALAAYLDEREDVKRFAGGGLQTFLRLANSEASVWKPIIDANRENLAPHAEEIARLVREIIEGDPTRVFERAQRFMKK